jgi:hypothetical protein
LDYEHTVYWEEVDADLLENLQNHNSWRLFNLLNVQRSFFVTLALALRPHNLLAQDLKFDDLCDNTNASSMQAHFSSHILGHTDT